MYKKNALRIILVLLVAAAIIIGTLLVIKYVRRYINEQQVKQIMSQIYGQASETEQEEINVQMEGYEVIGIIKIPKIELEYPILEKTNNQTLGLSITKFWGPELNKIGNAVLAGHNYINGMFFGDIKKLQEGDIIEITDKNPMTLKYQIYKTYVIDPNDISVIQPEEQGIREITLLTCTNGRANRLIVKAKEIKDM